MDIKQCLKVFCKLRPSQTTTIKEYVDKPDWVSSDKEVVLLTLSELLILPECTAAVAQCFPGILLELLHRASVGVGNAYEESTFLLMKHEYCCSALSKLASTFPVAKRFAVEYFKTHPSPFFRLLEASYSKEPELKKKKSSLAELCSLSDTEIVCVCYRLILLAFKDFSSLWDWSPFLFYLNHEDNTVKWFASLCVAALFEFSSGQTAMWLQSMFTKDQIVELSVRYGTSHGDETTLQEPTEEILSCLLSSNQSLNSVCLKSTDLINTVTSVGGVLLPNFQQLPSRNDGCLILTPTADKNLHSLVLAIKKGLPVLLQGPLGCGKTSLVEHLAQVTGRTESPHLMKVQLGDQTDSKMLLGTYHCTDVPGEFIWQPGTLLQAVHNGYWLLLEDIDYAPMDVISILVPLLETRTLTLPGNGIIKASPGFQLFATQRLMIGSSGCFKVHSGHVDVLEKLFTKISVQPLSDDELKQLINLNALHQLRVNLAAVCDSSLQVIVTRWPALSNVVNRIVEVYFLVSNANLELHYSNNAGPERSDEKLVDGFSNENLSPYDGRPISTRDLMKWCSRIADYLIGSSEIASLSAFQEALDCFCFSIGNSAKRIIVAEVIAARLNILKAKAEFFCTKHKPFIHITPDVFTVGRVTLPCKFDERSFFRKNRRTFAFTRHASVLLEQIAVAVKNCEPVLLVGETGTGKTATVQFLAEETGHTLVVINMNQQSESADLLGGFKPVDLKLLMNPLKEEYEEMFVKTFSRAQNVAFLRNISTCYNQRRWKDLLALMLHTQKAACHRLQKGENYLLQRWLTIGERISCLETQIKHSENALAFKFIEGSLVKALKTGSWILLDEINLASADTLECLCGLLESIHGSVMLLERGDVKTVNRHPEFKMFACMNPATDVGKKELPPGLRNRFTEFFMEDLEDHSDLCVLVQHYLQGLALSAGQIEGVVSFYLHLRKVAVKDLTDGTGHIPHYSLRTLCRALSYASGNPCKSIPRSLYEAFCLSFLTQLDRSSHPPVENLIKRFILEKQNVKSILHKPLPKPPGEDHALFEGFWILTGDEECVISESYILTPSIRSNLKDLARVAAAGRHPVLLQGGTSVGKTSLIKWLADSSGNRCVRVNNHEHTDLQEYIGSYAANHTGKLVFKEGVLVDAMRNGYWVILDELNLAPTDVLEALNRVLDDNRELFIPETQEVVKAHPRFMLFATQNPPGEYGGRKVLSRAFRNRFIELHFEEIPPQELEIILHKRCSLPPSYCKKLVAVMTDLQTRRSSSGIFAGKHGLITLRDLFRWAERYRFANYPTAKFYDWDQHLADEGYLLLAGRVRKDEETQVIASVIKKHFKCSVNPEKLFTFEMNEASPVIQGVLRQVEQFSSLPTEFGHVVWTFSMRRLAILMGQALQFNEPVLLVGETGCGKTTICQIYAAISGKPLYSVNCHMHSEGADFLGGLRPVRNRDHADDMDMKKGRFFEWANGPLVKAMMDGAVFLADEISLADDSVLERLNSVLEPERTLLLAEKGSDEASDSLVISAEKSFRFVSTMNPGGDYGKKELSPALRNRFTEIWCPSYNVEDDIIKIIEHNLIAGVHLCNQQDGTTGIGHVMLDFLKRFNDLTLGRRSTPSIRDILSWVSFINVATITDSKHCFPIDVPNAYIHGACLVFLDALGSGNSGNFSAQQIQATKLRSLHMLLDQIEHLTGIKLDKTAFGLHDKGSLAKVVSDDHSFGVIPFIIAKGPACCQNLDGIFTLKAPTSCMNALRVLRALQLIKPILLEGSPGVGKTSLVIALAKASGHNFVRINLSEQTDISDLFGADLPVEGGRGGQFAWHDGPLLRALKSGDWIILDELNLASQSVLEGLNACLDHRGEIYVPELGRTFSTPKYACRRIFACQNPLVQGGARKGLPKSFLNRFTQVYIESLSSADLELITCTMYPEISAEVIHSIVSFNQKMHVDMVVNKTWGTIGGPWEINLRDIFRWCDLVAASKSANPGEYVPLIYASRMRTTADRIMVLTLCNETFGDGSTFGSCHLSVTSGWLQVGSSILPRAAGSSHHVSVCTSLQSSGQLYLLPTQLQALQSLMKCVEMNWMSILVGPPSSGKSSLVSLIAGMTGNSLHVLSMNSDMDTTELLGGFEQTDLNRRLSYLSGDVYSVFNKIVAHLLISEKSFKEVQHLMESWARYESLQKTGRYGTTKEEAAHFLQKVNRLKETIRQLQQHQLSIANLSCLFEKLENLEKLVMQEEAVNCGGQFEWVDSLLVTALQKGHWLLIDNVNFCSPSVLDRLNGLLEPNGILTISERGLCDGEIPTYKPHPNFRLFLSMDPRNGEISRAMRNRGIEIYLGVEEVSPKVRMLELKTLLDDAQLYSLTAQKLLIKIHDSVTETFVGGDKPSINDLLRITHLTVQRMQEGEDISLAVWESCMEVYVHCQNVTVRKERAKCVIEDLLSGPGMKLSFSSDFHCYSNTFLPSPLLAVKEFAFLPELAKIKQDSSCLTYLICLIVCVTDDQKASIEVQKFLCEMLHYEGGMPSLKNLLDHIFVALKMFMLGSSFDNWQLRSQFFKSFLTRVMKSVCKNDCLKGIFNQLLSLAEYALDCACVTFSSEPAKNLLKKLESLFDNDEGVAVKEISFDLRWNQKLLNHLILKKVKPDTNPSYLLETLFSLANRCNVLFEFLLWRTSVVKELQDSVTVTNKQSPKQTSLLLMSFSRCKGVESFQNVPKILIDNLANFFLTLFDAMQKILSSCNPFPDDILMKWKVAIHWVARFWIACSESFPGNYLPSHHTTVLYLHWMWMSKKAFAVFFGDNWTLDKLRVYPSLWPIIEKLEEHFKTHVIHVNPLSYKVHQIIGHPHPYRSLSEAEINDSLQRIWLKAIGANPENCQLGSLVLFSCDALLAHRDKMKDIFTGDSDMQNDKLQNLEEQSVTLFTAFMNVHKQADLQWQFLPVVEHMALLKEQRCACLLLSKNTTDALLEICMARSLAHLTNFASPFHLAVIERLSRSDVGNVDDAVLLEYQYEYLNSIWHCSLPEAERPMNSKYVGPALLHSPVTNIVAAHILSDLLDASAIPSCKMLNPSSNVSLGSCSEKIKHLQDVSNLLWNYTEAAHGVNHDPLINDCSLFFATFLQLSLLLIEIADDKTQQNSSKDLHMLKTLNPRNLSQMADAMPIIQHISIYVSECGIILDELNKIWLHLTEDVISFLKSKSFMLKSIEDNIEMRDFVASAWIYLGYLQAILSIPIFDADPALRHKMKLAFFKEQEHSASVDLFIANVQSYLITGQQLAPSLTCKLHPMLELSQKCISEANPAIKNLERDQAVRPIPSQYEALRNEMIQYIETVGSGKNVLLFVEELKKFKKQKSKCCQSVCERVQGWIASQHSFLKKISCSYPWYRDLTLPSAVGILQMLHGMALLIYFTEREMQLNDLGIKVADLVETVQLLSAFPNISVSYLSSFALSRCLQNPVVKTIIFLLFSSEDCKAKANRHYLRILKSSLMEIWNQASTAGYLHKEELKFLHDTLHIFVLSWQHQEKERLNKEAEKESLYQYKGRDYGEIIDDEAQLQKSIKMTFPTYDEAFSDLTRLNDLEEQMNYDSLKNVDDDTVASDISGSITQQEFEDIVSAHNKLFIRYTACDWHQVEHSNYRPDFLMPLTVRYPVVADIVAHFGDILGKPVDASLINVHLVMSSVHQGILKPSSEMVPTKDCGSSYDFYYDSNITEVTQCRPILENFQKRVVELLLEWEEHPALKQLLKIINRILSFPATSPVMKFVTGLELLLAQAQDWEKNAHKGVSLFDHLEAVTKQIIQWRKLELSCWASYLDLVEWRTARQASRWWFYVYATTESWLSLDTSVDLQQDKNPAKTSLNDLCTTLQQFMETSPLGEFKERLDIFLAFACHLVHVPSSHKQRTLVSVFWNLYQYYKQFVSAVSLKICMLREPIVKELKDFIKISRWNDINFWAVKESVDKSHRTIHKHIRQYENCLKQLSHTAFSDADLLSKAENITDSATDFSDVKEKRFAWTSSTSSDNLFCIVDSENNPADILQRLPTLYGKAMNLCKKLTKKAKYSSLVATLDHYIGEIIANVHELQSLEINRTASKERQAVEAKNINLRKRKALSDLFKTLSVIGLSYRKGQLYYHTEGSWNVDIFTLPPLNCEAHYLNVKLSELDSTLLNVWKDCPQYFLRSFSRMALLQLSIQNPSKEIGPSNLQRCIGFSSHLLHMCIEQRRDLCNAFSKMIHLKTIMQYVEVSHPVLSAERLLLPPQESFKQWVVVLLDHLAQALQGLGQFVELLNSCPPSTDSTVINALLLNSPLDGVSQLRRGDPSLVDAISKVETCIHNVKEIQGSLSEEKMAAVSDTLVIWTWENVHRVTLAFKKLRNTADLFPLLHDGNGHSLLALLGYLKDLIISKAEQFNEWIKNYADFNHEEAQRGNSKLCDCSHLKKHVYKAACVLANKVLLGIQNLYKTEVTIQNLKKDSNLEGPSKGVHGKSIPDLEKGILVTSLHAALKNCLLVLDIDHIDASFTKLVCHWKAATDSSLPFDDINECTKFLLQSLPLINRYMSLVQFYFILLLKSHRVTAKMSSVLLGIFTELIQKGFCLPAEFSDLSGGEGSTKFEDIEGGGIGEGDGIKDVSDRIENEDQLEEAHQEGTEKQEQDAGDGPDIKDEENGIEMSEDFAGKLHDLDDNSQDESENESDKDNELDKQKGNLEGEDDAEKLDERIWGDDHENSEDDDEDEDDDDDKEDEYGPGDGPQEESRLVAKSDLKPSDKIDDKDTDEKNDPEDENKDISEQINMIDEREFDDHPDQYYNKQDEIEKQESENMDLADDLKLDNEENGEGEPENEIDEGKEENIEADAQDSDEGLPDIIKEEQHLSVDDEQTANDSVEKEKQEEVDGDEDSGNTTDNDSAKPEIGSGLEADDELGPEENEDSSEEKAVPAHDIPLQNDLAQPADDSVKKGSSDRVENANHSALEDGSSAINDNPNEETAGFGQSEADTSDGHDGKKSKAKSQQKNLSEEAPQHSKTRPGQSNEKRSLGSVDQPFVKRLKTEDGCEEREDVNKEKVTNDVYEHIKNADMHHDCQVLDAATEEQVLEQPIPIEKEDDAKEDLNADDDVEILEDEKTDDDAATAREKKPLDFRADQKRDQKHIMRSDVVKETDVNIEQGIIDGEQIETTMVERGPDSTIHTHIEHWPERDKPLDIEKLRQELEEQVSLWSTTRLQPSDSKKFDSKLEIHQAVETWHKYEEVTLQLAQDLCEKLRLILEPSLTAKLKGDYRTGKRLNMRKVIPYVASQFRKDKIWLRRTKPSKRDYQIMLAIDDSSSMADNHSKQLAFEALAVINKSLMLLEAGEVAIASFGENVHVVHQFGEQFTGQTGAAILQQFTFQQKKTKVSLVLDHAVTMMLDSRQRRRSGAGRGVDMAQLLIIVSDGRGVFSEGVDVLKKAVRRARDGGVFVVFVALDNPVNKYWEDRQCSARSDVVVSHSHEGLVSTEWRLARAHHIVQTIIGSSSHLQTDSIFDIRVPVFKGAGQLPEIKSYMDDFPFPFYLILRDINSLPAILSDALRQWFEFVNSSER